MHESSYSEIRIPDEVYDLSERLIDGIMPQMAKHFPSKEHPAYAFGSLDDQLPYLLTVLGGVKGKVILDLGCGSRNPEREGGGIDCLAFFPWLCRSLVYLGASPIGVDKGDLDGEEFAHHQVDLCREDALACIPVHSVDLANASDLFNSNTLRIRRVNQDDFKRKLVRQLERVLKPDGVFLYRGY
jgi:SAM-dependent methyltransferase